MYIEVMAGHKKSPHKRLTKYRSIGTFILHVVTISRYFLVLIRKIGIWPLTMAQSVGTSSEL